MLTRLRIHNFKTFLNFEIGFTRRHLLIGKNNSGKTNLCSAIRFLGATARMKLGEAAATCILGGIPEIRNWGYLDDQIDFAVTCELPFEGVPLAYVYELRLELADRSKTAGTGEMSLRLVDERLLVTGGRFAATALLLSDGHKAVLMHEEASGRPGDPCSEEALAPKDSTMLSQLYESGTNRRAILFRQFLWSWMYFHFSADSIRLRWRDAERTGSLYYADGRHLPSAVFQLKNENDKRYRRMIERVRDHFEPDLEAINFLVSPDQGVVPFVTLRGRPRASWASLSDGTLLALALSQLIEQANASSDRSDAPPPLMIIEEPETGLYVPILRELMESFEGTAFPAQFIFTSHSPYFIDLFDRDLSSVTSLRKEGVVTSATQLDQERGKIEKYRGDFSLGELHFKELFA